MKFTISLYASICLFLFIGCTSKPKQQEVQTNEDISQNNDAKVLEEFPNTDTTLQVIPPIKVTPKKTKPTDNDIQYNISKVMNLHMNSSVCPFISNPSLDDVISVDKWARKTLINDILGG